MSLFGHNVGTTGKEGRPSPAADRAAAYLKHITALSANLDFEPQVQNTSRAFGPNGESGKFVTWSVPVPPPELRLQAELPQSAPLPSRWDIDVGGLSPAFVIDNVFTPDEADAIVALTERLGYSILTPGGLGGSLRRNKACFWYANDAIIEPIFQRMRHLLPVQCKGRELYPRLGHRLHMYKYDEHDEFSAHVDGQGPGGQNVTPQGDVNHWVGQRSQYTMLIYLSDEQDGVNGGATRLYHMHNHRKYYDVNPRKGSVLCFRHGPTESVLHEGTRLGAGAPKYVVRTSLLYTSEE